MNKALNPYFLFLHIFVISWSSVLRLSDWAPLPFLFLLLATLFCFISYVLRSFSTDTYPIHISRVDYCILFSLFLMALSAIFQPTLKSFNYLLAYSSVFGCYLLLLALESRPINIQNLLKVNYYAINFICIFIILEVGGRFITGENIFEWIPRTREATATVTIGLYRAYGLATEPTQLGNYFCCFFPFAIYYAQQNNNKYFSFYLLFLFFAALLTFSAAMFLVSFSSLILFYIFTENKAKIFSQMMIIGLSFGLIALIFVNYLDLGEVLEGVLSTLTDKIFNREGISSIQRLDALALGLKDIANNPFLGKGLGAAGSKDLSSNINWYIFLGAEGGLIILFLFVFWFGFHFVHAVINFLETKDNIYLVSAIAIYGGMAYFIFLSTFQNLFLLTSIFFYRLILRSALLSKKGV